LLLPRKKIVWFPGAKYHITSRGVRRTNLFRDEEDREKYLSLLELAMKLYPFTLHTYCLMTNHVHLQIQTKNSPPSMIMKYMNTNYAKYFNKKYHHFGHVFDKRYGAELIDSSEYELDLSKYIHLNPLKAGMVERLEDYKWSSYLVYVHKVQSTFVSTKQILSYFPEPQSQLYEKYLKSGFIDLSFTDDGMLFFEHEAEV
jgi:putative transposase